MSYAAEKWARKQKAGNARAKAVLIELANCLNDSTGKCYPSIAHISRVTELKPDTVSAATKHLEAIGLIRRTKISTEKGHGIQYELIGYSKTEDSIELSESHFPENGDTPESGITPNLGEHTPENGVAHFPENGDTPESGITPNLGEHTPENGVAHYPENGDRTYKKEKEITGNTIIRENSPSDDFSLEPVSEDSTSKKIQSSNPLSCPYEELATLYNQVLGQDLGECRKLSPARKTALRSLWNECIKDKDFNDKDGGLAYFKRYFTFVRNTPFLVGKETAWKANFDWILKNNNYIKICEGFYNRPRNAQR